ncbi:Ni/Fe-hydrogenase cytochrome b subunit, partial [bacterium]|nr:Ni/Fe-hydrogenase cytochrome b subunit [bacterium]
MDTMDRRRFLFTLGAAGSSCLLSDKTSASDNSTENVYGVLTDTTLCIGCRKCEWACNDVNNMPEQSLESFEDYTVFDIKRRPDAAHYTIVNEYQDEEENPLWVKFQCMHCDDPACLSACLVTAFTKNEDGSVTYDPWKCMGCRYCMVACPYQIPTYEYDEALAPLIQKCNLCHFRTQEGKAPGCVEVCPVECLTYGKRDDLLAMAKAKIKAEPDKYIDHVYGEKEVGGSSWIYVANRPFEEIGFPKLAEQAPPKTTEEIQHGIFKYFMPQIAFFGFLGMVAKLTKNEEPEKEKMPVEEHPAPAAVSFFSPATFVLLFFALVGMGFALYRFIFGLESITNLNDQFPWGIWISIDVASGVALAAGGFTMSALVYICRYEKYHPLMRPALLTAVLGYTFVVIGLLVDLGKYYNVWHPMLPSMWSGHSVLFEVGMCVMFYLTVLYIEFLPAVTEKFKDNVNLPKAFAGLNKPVNSLLHVLDSSLSKVMLFFVIAGIVLSFMHQSSLGALMLIAPNKMHPLWYTPILPLLFLISAISVGYPMVVFESILASRMTKRKPEMHLLEPLSRLMPALLFIYLSCKVIDIVIRGVEPLLFDGSLQATMFHLELWAGVALPMVLLLFDRVRGHVWGLFASCTLIVLGVALNRINVFLTAYTP